MNRIRIDELNGKTLFCGVQINTHEQQLITFNTLETVCSMVALNGGFVDCFPSRLVKRTRNGNKEG